MAEYLEQKILLAVMEDDDPKAAQLLDDMLPGERHELRAAALHLADLAAGCPICGKAVVGTLEDVISGALLTGRRDCHRSCWQRAREEADRG